MDIFSKYEILGELGSGGFSKVLKARDKKLNKLFAIKTFCPDISIKDGPRIDDLKQRFIKEAHILEKCNHQNIVKVHHVNDDGNVPYIVMDYIEGRNLDEYINEKQPLNFSEIVRISQQILLALDYIHKLQLIHRDLKPQNIMNADKEEKLILIDFGLAKDLLGKEMTRINIPGGTPVYVSPEQSYGIRDVDYRTDIYSFGVILYKMVTGSVPILANGGIELKDTKDELPMLDFDICGIDVPVGIKDVIRRAMALNPNDRFQSALDLLEAISGVKRIHDENYEALKERLNDRYIFAKEIPCGLFSKLYLLKSRYFNHEFILKTLDLHLFLQALLKVKRCSRESIIASFKKRAESFALKAEFYEIFGYVHNIVKITTPGFIEIKYDDGEFRVPYLVLQKINGRSLEDAIAEGPMNLDDIFRISKAILVTLAEVHKKNFVIRELYSKKLILEDETGIPFFIGCGVAIDEPVFRELDISGTKYIVDIQLHEVMNTVPDRFGNQDKLIAADIGLFGMLLYQMIVGESEYSSKLLQDIQKKEYDDIVSRMKKASSIQDGLVPYFFNIIKKTLCKDRMRYREVTKVIKDFSKIKISSNLNKRWSNGETFRK